MINQDVKCPACSLEMPFDDFDDVYETEGYPNAGIYIERCCYTCPRCKKEFTANIYYTLKFKEISY